MPNAPQLLNDDGTASMATLVMMSHHGFRRDLARFARALAAGEPSRLHALREEWRRFRATLHGHHEAEDNGVFPSLASAHASVRATIEALEADHRRIDPLLERGDRAFAEDGCVDEAIAVVREFDELLHPHLATEESELIPFLRDAKTFPTPETDEIADVYAQGFAWAMHGIAPDVLDRVQAMLPAILLARLPFARAAFDERAARTWGSTSACASRTSVPENLADARASA
jgi:hemerythrin-like domain-containing protein